MSGEPINSYTQDPEDPEIEAFLKEVVANKKATTTCDRKESKEETMIKNQKQLGWMSEETDDSSTPSRKPHLQYYNKILDFQNEKVHRLNNTRTNWLYTWSGGDILDDLLSDGGDKSSTHDLEKCKKLFTSRMEFLKRCWGDYKHFRPFDTIKSSGQYLKSNPHADYIVRLSSTYPGYITITTRRPKSFYHKRYEINEAAEIVDEKGDLHKNIAHFATSHSINQYQLTKEMLTVGSYVFL